jgi:hypothetical protein
VHAVGKAHDTPVRIASASFRGSTCVDQLLPFQRTTPATPTAMHAVAEAHETLLSAPAALGMGWSDQLRPFQRSTIGNTSFLAPGCSPSPPTAMHAVGDGQEMAVSLPPSTVKGGKGTSTGRLGATCTDHLLPFQCSISGSSWLPAMT